MTNNNIPASLPAATITKRGGDLMKNGTWMRIVGTFALAVTLLGNSSLFYAVRLYAAPDPKVEFQGGEAKPVNVNKATLEELETVQGIGPTLGQRIIQYRDEHGPFAKPDDLMNVNGIGGVKLEKIKTQITV